MINAHEQVSAALDLLTIGLCPFVEQELKAVYRDDWIESARSSFRDDRGVGLPKGDVIRWDAHSLLTVMWDQWNGVFRNKLNQSERSLISELREFRNRWAHQQSFDFDDTYRILDSAQRLLKAVSAAEADEVARIKHDLLESEFAEAANANVRHQQQSRDKWMVVSVYIVCCAAIVSQLTFSFGLRTSWVISLAFITGFSYLILQKLRTPTPTFGPRECIKCGKIIYSDNCPYCGASSPVQRSSAG